MDSFLSNHGVSLPSSSVTTTFAVNDSILKALEVSNGSSERVKLHLATANDLHHVERLVDGLAVYEKEVGGIHVNSNHYRFDGFEGEVPLFKCLLLENRKDNHICGMAFFCFGYDLENGRFLYLEDLFIEKEHRGSGAGSLLMTTLASVAKSTGCTSFRWQALDWNTPALTFYDKIGAKVLEGLLTTRFNGEALRNFVAQRPANI